MNKCNICGKGFESHGPPCCPECWKAMNAHEYPAARHNLQVAERPCFYSAYGKCGRNCITGDPGQVAFCSSYCLNQYLKFVKRWGS